MCCPNLHHVVACASVRGSKTHFGYPCCADPRFVRESRGNPSWADTMKWRPSGCCALSEFAPDLNLECEWHVSKGVTYEIQIQDVSVIYSQCRTNRWNVDKSAKTTCWTLELIKNTIILVRISNITARHFFQIYAAEWKITAVSVSQSLSLKNLAWTWSRQASTFFDLHLPSLWLDSKPSTRRNTQHSTYM